MTSLMNKYKRLAAKRDAVLKELKPELILMGMDAWEDPNSPTQVILRFPNDDYRIGVFTSLEDARRRLRLMYQDYLSGQPVENIRVRR